MTLERTLRDWKVSHLEAKWIVILVHHGFCLNHLCLADLICVLDEVTGGMNRTERVEVRYLDSQQAS